MINTPNWPTFQTNSSGDKVRALQYLLNYRINANLTITGNFDATTSTAVYSFKSYNNLPANGVADAATITKLVENASLSNTNAAKAAQTLLKQFEPYSGFIIDGDFGTKTSSISNTMARAFNMRMEISSDHVITSTTWQYLFGYSTYPAFIAPAGYSTGQKLLSVSDFIHRDSIDLLARMIYGEASNPPSISPSQEQYGVANAANNRKNKGNDGCTFVAVLLAPGQFTSMNGGQTLNPDLTSTKWKTALSAAQNFSSNNPIGNMVNFCAYGYYTGTGNHIDLFGANPKSGTTFY